MPWYDIEHITPLTGQQKDELAMAMTTIHAEKFHTPTLFVNCRFTEVKDQETYVAGKRRHTNRIFGHVRPGGRAVEDFNDLCLQLIQAWDKAVNNGQPGQGNKELRGTFIFADLTAASEAGFILPEAGNDKKWIRENKPAFEKLAAEGDEDWKGVLKEFEEKAYFK
ncbi:MAG: hypothetical protein M1830_007213 [Pleopsidium flavum]|nr:MAG: hypothetical protein M1830_007213 [Pleopsidium flavum]